MENIFAKETYKVRRALLAQRVTSGGIILLPGNNDVGINYPNNAYDFRQESTFLYFFGIQQPNLVGLIDLDSDENILYGDDTDLNDIIWTGVQPSIQELGDSVGIRNTQRLDTLKERLELAIRKGRKIHFLPPYRAETTIKICDWLGISISSVTNYISVELAIAIVSIRDKKSAEEIAQIEIACETGYMMHAKAMQMCRVGVCERDIAKAIEAIAQERGAGRSFRSIVSQHGEVLHNLNYNGTLTKGKLLLIDAGAETLMNYCSDFTRTIPVSGKFTQKQKDIYEIVLAANNRAFELSKPEVSYMNIHLEASMVLVDGLKALGLMKGDTKEAVASGAHALFMPHGLGHMMGLDVHDMENIGEQYVGYDLETERSQELGVSSLRMGRKLESGMVMTVEPGIYFIPDYIAKWQHEGLNREFINFDKVAKYLDFGGIRIEDNLLVTDDGCRMLGEKRIPATIEEIENFMK